MGNAAYDARCAAELAEAEQALAAAKAGTSALEAITDFLRGGASVTLTPVTGPDGRGVCGTQIRFVRDPPA